MQHQRFLESLDAKQRRGNIIITGLPETPLVEKVPTQNEGDGTSDSEETTEVTHDTDEDKVNCILAKIGAASEIDECTRLGKVRSGNEGQRGPPKRALKVTLVNPESQKEILEKAKALKEEGGLFERVFIKRDMHPMVRREFNRMREVEKAEKEKPENRGRDVRYDPVKRTLSVNGVVIDQFKPQFFQ